MEIFNSHKGGEKGVSHSDFLVIFPDVAILVYLNIDLWQHLSNYSLWSTVLFFYLGRPPSVCCTAKESSLNHWHGLVKGWCSYSVNATVLPLLLKSEVSHLRLSAFEKLPFILYTLGQLKTKLLVYLHFTLVLPIPPCSHFWGPDTPDHPSEAEGATSEDPQTSKGKLKDEGKPWSIVGW